jgi:hypothetical protein
LLPEQFNNQAIVAWDELPRCGLVKALLANIHRNLRGYIGKL